MNFYRRRPLALAISICLLASAAAAFLPGIGKLVFMTLVLVGTPVIIIVLKRRFGFGHSADAYIILTAALLLSSLLTSFVSYDIHAAKYKELDKARIKAVVIDVRGETDYSSSYTVRLLSANGKHYGGKGILHSESSLSAQIGDIIKADAVFEPISSYFDYAGSSELAAMSDGYVFVCSTETVRCTGTSNSPEILFAHFREYISSAMGIYLEHDVAAMTDALFLGIREGLGVIRRDFTYMGVTHILALSGLHIVVLSAAVEKFLSALRIGKRIRSIICVVFILFYVALTGFLLSAVRAAMMVILTYVASAVGRRSDGVTALFFAVFVIVLVSPGALWDVSLQMSFFATLGVILMSEAAEGTLEGKGGFAAKLKKSVGSVAASVGAVMFVLPLQWLYFGEMSPMSVLATLLLSFLCEGMLILYIPYAITALVGFHYLAAPLAGIITAIYRICAFAADKLADISSLVSLRYPFAAPIIIICIAVIVVMMVKNVKNWLWSLIPFAAASVIFFGCVHIHDAVGCDKTVLNYINFEAHDAVAAVNGRRAVVFDMTDGAAKAMDSIRYTLSDNYVTEIDTYVLTDVSLRHIGALRNMLKYRVIHKVYIPMAQQENEIFYVSELMRTAKEYGAKAVLYSRSKETVMSIGDVRVTMPQHTELERSVKPLSALRFECGDEIVTYVGSSAWENEYVWDFTDNADSVIIGANGPVCKSSPEGKLPKTVKELYCPSEDVLKSLGKWVDRDRVSVKTLVRFVMTARN